MNKILLTSAVALATFGAAQAVSANETVTEANNGSALVQPALPELKLDAVTGSKADKAESTDTELTIADIYNHVPETPATTVVEEVKPVKIMDENGAELKLEGKAVEIKPEKDGTKVVDVKGAKATYRLTVEIKEGKAKLVKHIQVLNNKEEKPEAKTGWVKKENGKWEYVRGVAQNGEKNVLTSGWANLEGTWYLFDANGEMATGWHFVGGKWYFLKDSGAMATGWVKDNGTWYFLNSSGAMETGWLKDGNTWYYLNSNGSMKANTWFELNGKWYYVNASGALAVNTTVGGYMVNGNGEWVR